MPFRVSLGYAGNGDGEWIRIRYLLLLFILVPAAELAVFLQAGRAIGIFPTIAIVVLTGFLGAYLAKRQGVEAWRRAQEQARKGEPPGDAILDGICVLAGGLLLLTPGFVTDAAGLLFLIPFTRKMFKPLLMKMMRNRMGRKSIYIYK